MSIVISFFAWCVFALSSKYFYELPTPIQYVNAPENKAFHPLQSDTVTLKVEGTGWQIFFSKLRLQPQPFKVDLSGLKNRNWVMFSTQLNYLNRQVPGNQTIISVSPDTLYFDFSKQTVKKIPVALVSDLSFRKQYNVIDEIKIKPPSITVTGPDEDLASITHWETEPLIRKDVHENLVVRLPLNNNSQGNLNIYPSSVEVTIPVGETTEKVLDIPIKIENSPRGLTTTLLPGTAKVTVSVPLKHYSEVNSRNIEAKVVLDPSSFTQTTLPVIIENIPEYCVVLKIEPQNVDYLISK